MLIYVSFAGKNYIFFEHQDKEIHRMKFGRWLLFHDMLQRLKYSYYPNSSSLALKKLLYHLDPIKLESGSHDSAADLTEIFPTRKEMLEAVQIWNDALHLRGDEDYPEKPNKEYYGSFNWGFRNEILFLRSFLLDDYTNKDKPIAYKDVHIQKDNKIITSMSAHALDWVYRCTSRLYRRKFLILSKKISSFFELKDKSKNAFPHSTQNVWNLLYAFSNYNRAPSLHKTYNLNKYLKDPQDWECFNSLILLILPDLQKYFPEIKFLITK